MTGGTSLSKRKYPEDVTSQRSGLPKKQFFRQRAHVNPFSDYELSYPSAPEQYDWHSFYPAHFPKKEEESQSAGEASSNHVTGQKVVEFADIGCGYGGLMMSLSPLFPDTLILGMEIRDKVAEYVDRRVQALREQNMDKQRDETGSYQNVAVHRMNAMRFLSNFFKKGQLTKMFFLFPDPHFKAKKHKHRIITPQLLAEYAYTLRIGGLLYTCTDVRALHEWMVKHIDAHPLFERIPNKDLEGDPCIPCVMNDTEEGKKVARNNGDKFLAVYRRIDDAQDPNWKGFAPLFDKGDKNDKEGGNEEDSNDDNDGEGAEDNGGEAEEGGDKMVVDRNAE
ncbi:hypothetical protein SmJEL517_g04201 [Synchytrium microbalum]|uniref:tRNA (guanine-N(7)-)-methyltransferase n=1 Tax=Synchytrium microbalum TaxID=1806994 RepID=A0A507C5H2_9FUNG|nr:uncharacterized protein SmJEL517_g04201 [Synchytrium microbalum]TPX32695.1 hypothetical protein SmJEL517_g04201 [Synchytrium microbalum]